METTLPDNKMQINPKSASSQGITKKETAKTNEPSITEELSEKAAWLKEETMETYDSSMQLIRKNPVTSIAVATGVGIVIGMFFKNRH